MVTTNPPWRRHPAGCSQTRPSPASLLGGEGERGPDPQHLTELPRKQIPATTSSATLARDIKPK
ncbi:Hypothetical predicted protein, partial [Pelobates cultripes]